MSCYKSKCIKQAELHHSPFSSVQTTITNLATFTGAISSRGIKVNLIRSGSIFEFIEITIEPSSSTMYSYNEKKSG